MVSKINKDQFKPPSRLISDMFAESFSGLRIEDATDEDVDTLTDDQIETLGITEDETTPAP